MTTMVVTPVKTGVQCFRNALKSLDSGFRRNDVWTPAFAGVTIFARGSHD